jgi:transcriptional regulator with XRE-family HTH domain
MGKSLEVSDRIAALRLKRGETQTQFAAAVGVTQQSVSDWESKAGDDVPSADSYVRLGNLASYPDCLWFWQQAGMNEGAMLSAATKLSQERGTFAATQCVLVPPFRKKGESTPKPEDFLPWPAKYIPDPSSVAYRQIDHRAGDASSAIGGVELKHGTVILLDTSDNDAAGLQPFLDKVILVESKRDPKLHFPGTLPTGVYMGRLHVEPWAGDSLDHMRHLAVLGPPDGPLGALKTETTGRLREICLGEGSSTTKWRLRDPKIGPGHFRAWEMVKAQATEDAKLFPGCMILGRVLTWFRPPSIGGK